MMHDGEETPRAAAVPPRDEALPGAVLDSLLDPVAVVEAVRDGRGQVVDFVCVAANRAACVFFSRSREELTGAGLRALLPGASAELLSLCTRVLETGDPLVADDVPYGDPGAGEPRIYDLRAARFGDALTVTWRDVTGRHEESRRFGEFTAALAESEARLQRTLAAAGAGIWEYDVVNDVLTVSDEVWRLAGREPLPGPATLEQWLAVIDPRDVEVFRATLEECVREEKPGTVDYRVDRGEPGEVWLSSHGTPQFDDDGRLTRFVGVVIDVTGRKRLELALRESETRYRLFAEYAGDVVFQGGDDGLVRWVSPSVTALLGWRPEELVGTAFADLLHPDDRGRVGAARATTPAGGELRLELRVRDSSGGYHWLAALVRDVEDPDTGLVARVGSWRDIQAEVEARHALAASERHYRALSESTPDFIFVIGRDLRVQYVNEAAAGAFGRPAAELAGCELADLFDPRTAARMASRNARVLETGVPAQVESSVPGPWGTTWLATWLVPIFDERGEVDEVLGTSRDITALKTAEQRLLGLNAELEARVAERTRELEATNEELEAFAYSISHDLRAPLRAIDGFSHLIAQDFGATLPEEGREDLQRIRAAAQKMGQLIDAMLALSRLSRQQVDQRRVDLSAAAEEAAAGLREQYLARAVEFTAAPCCVALADADLAGVVLTNLLDNAWKFTAARSPAHVEFGCAEADGERVFFVSDDGAGFDPAFAGKLFQPFQRLHAEDEYAGTGIGLATVQRIVARLGGRCWAEGAEGEGATFFFTLPEA